MDTTTQSLDLKNIDKSTWESYRFEEIVKRVSESVDPNTTDLKVYVGLEHIDADNIHIKRFGTPDDVSGGKLKCYPGDVIFGKRRAYQRKAAVVEFEGICSAHAFVFRANAKVIDSKLFPFFLHSDQFMHRMVDISVGGLSPTINWGDLKHQEFLLPPKDQQAQLAELLWAMDEVVERESDLFSQLENTYSTLVDNLFSKRNEEWDFVRLGKISSINAKALNSKTNSEYEFQYLDLAGIIEPKVIGELKRMKFEDAPSRAKRIVDDNSIVLAMVRPYQKAFAFIKNGKDLIASTGTAIINMQDNNLARFVFHQFFSKRFTRYCEDQMTGTSYPAITPKDVSEYKVSIPNDIERVKAESKKLDDLENSSLVVRKKIENSKSLQKSLINQIF